MIVCLAHIRDFLLSEDLQISYSRSSGPGGQNVNKGLVSASMKLICPTFQMLLRMALGHLLIFQSSHLSHVILSVVVLQAHWSPMTPKFIRNFEN